MTAQEFEDWKEKNGTACRDYYANGAQYKLVTMRDSWIAVFESYAGNYDPLIQAQDMKHAESYCNLREVLNVPAQPI